MVATSQTGHTDLTHAVAGPKTLTDFEQSAFAVAANLADGHAYQELTASQQRIVDDLPNIWLRASTTSIPDSEFAFRMAFSNLVGSQRLADASLHLLLPTASNSIDLVGAYLHGRSARALLIEPTFDNLALIMTRRGVPLLPLAESRLFGDVDLSTELAAVDALILVNPNNPSGAMLSEARFRKIIEMCIAANTILVIDGSFRLFYKQTWDSFARLIESGVSVRVR